LSSTTPAAPIRRWWRWPSFLAGYGGRTREAYALDLKQFFTWCTERHLRLFDAHRTDIELYARELEERGRARATIGRRLSTIAGFYRYAAEEGLIEHSPAVHVRRPRIDYESHAVGLDRNELGALLVAAGPASAQDHALASLLALNGLRISEALGADIEQLGLERGHRTLVVHRKGAKTVTVLDVKRRAMTAHANQIPETASPVRLPTEAFAAVYGYEWYVRRGPPGPLDALG
jgi:site-specific recombinase XerD